MGHNGTGDHEERDSKKLIFISEAENLLWKNAEVVDRNTGHIIKAKQRQDTQDHIERLSEQEAESNRGGNQRTSIGAEQQWSNPNTSQNNRHNRLVLEKIETRSR